MSYLVAIDASPVSFSRSQCLLKLLHDELLARDVPMRIISLKRFVPAELLGATAPSKALLGALNTVSGAQAIITSTPVFDIEHGGLLKTFLDLLPSTAFAGKSVLPIATSPSFAQLLAHEHELSQALFSLSAHRVMEGIYATDSDLIPLGADFDVHDAVRRRLDSAVDGLVQYLSPVATKIKAIKLEALSI